MKVDVWSRGALWQPVSKRNIKSVMNSGKKLKILASIWNNIIIMWRRRNYVCSMYMKNMNIWAISTNIKDFLFLSKNTIFLQNVLYLYSRVRKNGWLKWFYPRPWEHMRYCINNRVSEWLFLNTKWVMYHAENKIHWRKWWKWCLFYTRTTRLIGSL